jgi:hypothetical protein
MTRRKAIDTASCLAMVIVSPFAWRPYALTRSQRKLRANDTTKILARPAGDRALATTEGLVLVVID